MPTPVNGVNEQIKIALQQKAATVKEQNNINDSIFNVAKTENTNKNTAAKEKPAVSKPIPEQIKKIINGNFPVDLNENFTKYVDGKRSLGILKDCEKDFTPKEKEVLKAYIKYVEEYAYWQTKRSQMNDKEFSKAYKKLNMADGLSGFERVTKLGNEYRMAKLEDQKAKLEDAKKQAGTDKALTDAINQKIKETNAEIEKEKTRSGK